MKSKILLTSFIFVFVLSILILFEFHYSTEKEAIERFQAHQLFTSKQLAKELEVYLRYQSQSAEKLSSLVGKNNALLSSAIQEYFQNITTPNVLSISLLDEKGRVSYSTIKGAVELNFGETQFSKWGRNEPNKGEQFISTEVPEIFSSPNNGQSFRVIIASPMFSGTNKGEARSTLKSKEKLPAAYAGLLIAVIGLGDILTPFLQSYDLHKEKQSVWILDEDGTVLYQPTHPEMVSLNIRRKDKSCSECHNSFDYIETILSKNSGTTNYELKETSQKLSSFASLRYKNLSWKIVVNVPLDEVSKFADKNLLQTVGLVFVLVFTLIGSAFYVFRSKRAKILLEEEGKRLKEQIALQEKVRETEEHYKSVVDNSPDAILIVCEGKIVFVNPAAIELVGATSPEDLVGKTAIQFVHSDDKQFVSNKLYEALTGGITSDKIEGRFIKMDGSIISVEVVGSQTTFNGKPSFQSIISDITEKKKVDLEREVLYEITEGITTTHNLNELLKLIHHSLGKVIYAENCFIALYDRKTKLFNFPFFIDKFDPQPPPMAMKKSCTSYIFKTGKPLLLTQEKFDQLVEQDLVVLVGTNSPSWIGVPLLTPTETIGVLVLQNYETENIYSESDLQLLSSVGNQIALAIERKSIEEAFKNERLLLRTVINNIPDSIYCKDTESRKTLANLADINNSGAKSEEEILGKTDFDIFPKELAEGFFADDQQVIQTGVPVLDREEYVLNEKGQKEWLLTSKLPLKDEAGKIIGIVGIGRNITNRKRAEEALSNERTLLRTIIDLIPDAIYAKDSKGRKILANPKEVYLCGKENEKELLGKTDSDLHPDDKKKGFLEEDERILHSGDSILNIEGELIDKDGQLHWLLGSKVPLRDASGKIIGVVGVNHDITERKLHEKALAKTNEKLSKTVAEKDKFFSIIAHDLRSPFNGFLQFTELMMDEIESFSTEEIIEFSKNMHQSAANLYKLIENLLEWAQMQRGTICFDPNEISVNDMVSQGISTIQQRAEQKGIAISSDLTESFMVYADEKMVNAVFRNLLSNSVKFSSKEGKIIVKAKKLSNQMLEVSISDTGVGMTEKTLNKLFKMNEKVGSKGTDGEPSTGLGLLLCKEFVEKQGGTIWVESEVGKGSTFYFTLPIIKPETK